MQGVEAVGWGEGVERASSGQFTFHIREDYVSLPVLMQNILNTRTGMQLSITAFNCADKIHFNNNVISLKWLLTVI